jgi:hypothetical protein
VLIGGSSPGLEEQALHSPHNVYIGIAGEVGVFGLFFFVMGHLYVALVAPLRHLDAWARLAGTLALAILLAGITEMRDGYGLGVATIALVAARGAALHQIDLRRPHPRKGYGSHLSPSVR